MASTDNYSLIKTRLLSLLAGCLATSGLLLVPQVAFGDVNKQSSPKVIEQLETSNVARDFLGNTSPGQQPAPEHATAVQTSYLISPAYDEIVSNGLLGFLFFVLPTGIAFAIWKQEKYHRNRSLILEAQVQILELIWKKSL